MAVVQISKIQLRRGQKNSVSGIPQLASAEMAWAVDAQELYIGNGSVAEGAPYVGNTRILTEHENILGLISSYQYAADDLSLAQYTANRSIQDKLDERLTVTDFGITPDVENISAVFNAALAELYNPLSLYKKELIIPNGEYTLDGDLYIPSNTVLRGETDYGVILNIGEFNIFFVSENGTTFNNITSGDFPINVTLSNMVIQRTTGIIDMSGLKQSLFDRVTVIGDFFMTQFNDANEVLNTQMPAIFIDNVAPETNASGIVFNQCLFAKNSVSVGCQNRVTNKSVIRFNDCQFRENFFGTYVEGIAGIQQDVNWTYKNCTFERIYQHAFWSTGGRGTVIRNSTFIRVGNQTFDATTPAFPMVKFDERAGNIVVDCYSDRVQSAQLVSTNNVYAYEEVENADKVSFLDVVYQDCELTDNPLPFMVLSGRVNTYVIDYVVRLGINVRQGTLQITVSDSPNPGNDEVSIIDDYVVSPQLSSSPEGRVISDFEFSATIHDNNADGNKDTIALSYRNSLEHLDENNIPIAAGQTGDMSLSISYSN